MASVLVVDDDPGVRQMMQLMLAVEGHQAEFVADGATAIERLDGPPVDLVILDVMMPGADGYDVLAALRAKPAWEDKPVVMCTALSGDEDAWKGWVSGADYVMNKPFEADDLRDVVLRLLTDGR